MKNVLTLSIFFLFLSQSAFAQENLYNDYRFPDVKYKVLDLQGDLYGNRTPMNSISKFNLRGNLNLSQSIYSNQSTNQRITFRNFRSNFQKLDTFFTLNSNILLQDLQRKYKDNGSFLELGYSGSLGQSYIKKSTLSNFEASVKANVGIGKGRIDVTNKVALSQFLLKDLMESGILTEVVSTDKILALAALMDSYNFTRILDNRVYRVEFITAVGEWLRENTGLKTGNEIRLTAIVTDNLLYAATGFRTSGNRWSINLRPNIDYINLYQSDGNGFFYGSDLAFVYAIHRPINQYSQNTYIFYAGIGANQQDEKSNSFERHQTYYDPTAAFEYSRLFNPNSRTLINLRSQLVASYQKASLHFTDQNNKINGDVFYISPAITLNSSYFVNYHLKLYLNAGLSYRYNLYQSDNTPMAVSNNYITNKYWSDTDFILTRNAYPFPTFNEVYQSNKLIANIHLGITYNFY
ncbi:MAG: hypothetical protein J5I59_03645 [Saprospiraceae bacterium]|nr:hypothetical protein [Saprospiraceae bacterium]